PDAAHRLTDAVGESHIAEVKFIERIRAQRLSDAKAEQLCPPQGRGVKAGDVSATLACGVGIVLKEVVEGVVSGEGSPIGVGVNSQRPFVVAKKLVVPRGGEVGVS